jgi:hypothetical protein
MAFVEEWTDRRLGHSGIRPDRKRLDNIRKVRTVIANRQGRCGIVNPGPRT